MKITDINIDIVERNLEFVGDNVQDHRGASAITGGIVHQGILRIKTDQGIEGNSMVGNHRGDSMSIINNIFNKFSNLLIGQNPLDNVSLWTYLNKMPKWSINRFSPMDFSSWASIDVALWDLKGKVSGLPVYSLLGGNLKQIPAYGTYQPRHNDPEGYVRESDEMKDLGLKAYKIHPGPMDSNNTIKMVNLVRNNVDENYTLMLDPNNSYNYEKALKIGKVLDDNFFYWFEDPIRWDDFESIKNLSKKIKTPLAMSDQASFLFNENKLYVNQLAPQIMRGTSRKLGITGLMKSCAVSEAFGKRCEIGTGGNIFFNMANIHVTCSINNCTYYEYWMPTSTADFATLEIISLDKDGKVGPNNKPGLGLTLNEEWIVDNKIFTIKES
ncbi:MAG: enolase C-terminal domain-like protein [Chloroflexota bacterium]